MRLLQVGWSAGCALLPALPGGFEYKVIWLGEPAHWRCGCCRCPAEHWRHQFLSCSHQKLDYLKPQPVKEQRSEDKIPPFVFMHTGAVHGQDGP